MIGFILKKGSGEKMRLTGETVEIYDNLFQIRKGGMSENAF